MQTRPRSRHVTADRRMGSRAPVARLVLTFALAIATLAPAAPVLGAQQLTSPEQFFGFQMGADRKLARWDKMVEYYKLLERGSGGKMKVVDMGPTTMGNPFLVLYISSPANMAKLEEIRQTNARLSDPRGIAESEAKQLAASGKAVIVQSFGLHSSEVAASQTAIEVVHDMLTRNDEDTRRILDNVISIMIPCFNPDGEILVTDWYNKYVGTEYEGIGLPVLYHKYIGHDNNRDAFQTNMVESQYVAKLMFRDWVPQAYVDHHQMGAYGARLYVPPYADPIRPSGDPLVWREMSWYGAHIAYKEEEAGMSGVVNAAIYSGWGHFGFHWITPFHNIAGMLTESASARLATPLYLHPDQLQGGARGLPVYQAQTTFPNPWPGGWWRVRDIVERQKIATHATLDLAAKNRETVLWNAYLKAKRQRDRGASGKPVAYVVAAEQHDPLTANKMINKLLAQGIEIHRSSQELRHDGRVYGAGSFVIPMAQPKMGVVRWLLGRTFYPDNSYTRDNEGNPIRPYDMSGDVMAEFMGVRVDPVDTPVTGGLVKVTSDVAVAGRLTSGSSAYVLDGRLNDSFRAVNLLWEKGGVSVRRVDRAADGIARPGDFVVTGASDALATEVARKTGVDFAAFRGNAANGTREMRKPRVAMYQRYNGGNMDEGWTRFVLEQWNFAYTSLMDAELKAGNLDAKYDAIILPSDGIEQMTGERPAAAPGGARGGGGGGGGQLPPPEYRSGFGQQGVDALRSFVEKGGTLVTFAEAGALAIERFGLPLRNAVAGVPSKQFWSPGSTLKVRFDTSNPIAYGMPEEGLATFVAGSQVYAIVPSERNERVETIATYLDRDILQSGWLIGEQLIANKAAAVTVEMGRGKVVLLGFRPQHRAQAHGTFKLVFNALMSAPNAGVTRAATSLQ